MLPRLRHGATRGSAALVRIAGHHCCKGGCHLVLLPREKVAQRCLLHWLLLRLLLLWRVWRRTLPLLLRWWQRMMRGDPPVGGVMRCSSQPGSKLLAACDAGPLLRARRAMPLLLLLLPLVRLLVVLVVVLLRMTLGHKGLQRVRVQVACRQARKRSTPNQSSTHSGEPDAGRPAEHCCARSPPSSFHSSSTHHAQCHVPPPSPAQRPGAKRQELPHQRPQQRQLLLVRRRRRRLQRRPAAVLAAA